jgi:RNA polymerase sigma-70 factor (ECF subfamily)
MSDEYYRDLIDAHGRLVWAVCGAILRNVGTVQDIEECVADVFIEVWKSPDKYNPDRGDMSSYLKLVAKSRALNMHRRLKSRGGVLDYDEAIEVAGGGTLSLEDSVIGRIGEGQIMSEIASLKEPDREIFYRRHCFEQKPREIARCMNLPEREVRNRLYQSKKKLQFKLKGGSFYEEIET